MPRLLALSPLLGEHAFLLVLIARTETTCGENRFQSVTDRFLADLQHIHAASKETEPRVEQLIRGMRWIVIRVFPMEAFEEAAELMESLAGIFEATQSSRLRSALAVTINQIISPIALVCRPNLTLSFWWLKMKADG